MGHSYVLKDARNGPPCGIRAVCLKRPCLLSVSGPPSRNSHQVRIAKDLLPMASNSPEVVESLERTLSRAVDADPKTFFESKQGSSSNGVVSESD